MPLPGPVLALSGVQGEYLTVLLGIVLAVSTVLHSQTQLGYRIGSAIMVPALLPLLPVFPGVPVHYWMGLVVIVFLTGIYLHRLSTSEIDR